MQGFPLTRRIKDGDIVQNIVEQAKEDKIHMMVIVGIDDNSEDRTKVTPLAEKTVTNSPCSVLVCKREKESPHHSPTYLAYF